MNIWQKTIPLWQAKIILLLIVLLALGIWAGMPAGTLAQGVPSPTPTDIGAGGGGSGNGGGSGGGSDSTRVTPVSAGAGVSGRVYNYSTNAYEQGVPVVISGDGWQAETFSDSNGYYRFDGLGTGRGAVNLRLPPGTQPVVVDWPVWTYQNADLNVDLGFYWGDEPPMPVLLSANLEDNVLTVRLENFTSAVATGGALEVETPGKITISPAVDVVFGSATMAYDAHQTQLAVSNIPPGDEVLMHFSLSGPSQFAGDDWVRVTFTYDQQYTPQVVIVEPNKLQSDAAADMTALEEIDEPDNEQVEQANSQTTPQPDATPVPSSSQAEASTEDTVEPTPLSQLPVTGIQPNTTSGGALVFSVIVMMGLLGAGWWSIRANSLADNDE